ncbi:MAG: oligosaccharide flippase family protein [Lachnospiraceae bacterium]|nr:oligosaccharide flippase family protein [Lachnospiraceae bacterium]
MSSQDKSSSPVKGFLTYFYGNFVVLLLGFIQTPLLTRILSTGEYGKTGMFETAVTVIYIFAILGLDQAYIRYYYEKDIDRGALLRKCLIPALAIVSFLSVVYIILSKPVNFFLFGATGSDVVALVVIYTFISVFERFFFLDVRMQQNGVLYSNINIIEKLLSIITIIAAFYFIGNDYRVGLYALVIPWSCTTLFLIIRYFIIKRGSKLTDNLYAPSYKELISYGFPFITVLLMEWALSSCDRLALRSFSTFDELGIYNAGMKIVVLLITFKNTFVAYWSPVAMERFENGNEEENRIFFRNAYETVVMLCVSGASLLIMFRKFIVLLLGPSYRSAESVIPFLTLMPIYAIMFEITVQSVKYLKKGSYLNIASLIALVVNVMGNMLLVPGFGGMGAAVTTGVSYIVYFIIGTYFSEKCIDMGYRHKKTLFYSVLLFAYCVEASFINNVFADSVCGILFIMVVFFTDRKILKKVLGYAGNFIKK